MAPTFPPDWRLRSPQLLAETFSSRVWKVAREDGSTAAVKALKDFPDVYDEMRGGFYLRWREGIGAIRLLEWDGRDMLLEHADGPLLSDVLIAEGDAAATGIAAETLLRLLSTSDRPYPADLQPLRERFAALFAKARDDNAFDIYREATDIAEPLLADQRDVRPLHGDLHHGNILHSSRGWLAIDPKGVLGDPAFDAANLFYNPLDRDDLCLDPQRIADMADILGRALDRSPARLLDFAFTYGCLSAAWHAGDGNTKDEARELAVARAVRNVRLNL